MHCRGWNDFGQLGLGHRDNLCNPTLIERMKGKKVRSISCGYFHTLCLCVNYKKPPKPTKEMMKREMEEEIRAAKSSRQSKKQLRESAKAAAKRRGTLGKAYRASKAAAGGTMASGSMSMGGGGTIRHPPPGLRG